MDGEYKEFNAIQLNIFRARNGKEFDNLKRILLDKMIKDINSNAREIIDNYIKPLTNEYSNAIEYSRFKCKFDISATTNSRLLINTAAGLGKTVFEVGLNIHPLFSIPYIPASSIKGSLRSYIHNNYPDKECIFGDEDSIGRVMVLDAYPIYYKNRLVDGEVTTPIYGSGDIVEKIQEHKAEPTPIIYPCIAKGVTFRFIVAFNNKDLVKPIQKYFEEMLKEGIGAKTLVGYGEFSEVKQYGSKLI